MMQPARSMMPPPPCLSHSYSSARPQYGATVIALLVYAAPMYFAQQAGGPLAARGQGEQTADYIRAMRLLSNTSR